MNDKQATTSSNGDRAKFNTIKPGSLDPVHLALTDACDPMYSYWIPFHGRREALLFPRVTPSFTLFMFLLAPRSLFFCIMEAETRIQDDTPRSNPI